MKIRDGLLSRDGLQKLEGLRNPHMMEIVERSLRLLRPARATVITDAEEDIRYVREMALRNNEEHPLATEGHTVHFDGYHDQGRDKLNTQVLIEPDMKISRAINTMDRQAGLSEILEIMAGTMEGKEALIRFFCLGPLSSTFSISALQITDSAYVAHSEDILYRSGYEQFRRLEGSGNFFTFIHSAGRLDARGNCLDIDKRRVYIDVVGNQVLTINNQYAGNSVGLKKLGLRLAIHRANNEDWLAEHMFIMAVKPEGKDRRTYFAGAFPSACGKTSTAMIAGQEILGDDIAFLRGDSEGYARGVNTEQGIFGIIMDINPEDDPVIYRALTTPRELIFSNVLVHEGQAYWLGMGRELPANGRNHFADRWCLGDTDHEGRPVEYCHKNARYTIRVAELDNADPALHDPAGVRIAGIIYGGRDSDTSVPVYQSFDWVHGVTVGATLESETTFATLDERGVRSFNPMANLDFLVVTLGRYIANHIRFGRRLSHPPIVFATNYFLKAGGAFLNRKTDKKVWLLWMEGRIHGEFAAIQSPIGHIPCHTDLRNLFRATFDCDYGADEYEAQFAIRVDRYAEKLERMHRVYSKEHELPREFTGCLDRLRRQVDEARRRYGTGEISPFALEQPSR